MTTMITLMPPGYKLRKKLMQSLQTIGGGIKAQAYLKGPDFATDANDAYVSLRMALFVK